MRLSFSINIVADAGTCAQGCHLPLSFHTLRLFPTGKCIKIYLFFFLSPLLDFNSVQEMAGIYFKCYILLSLKKMEVEKEKSYVYVQFTN